MYPIDILPPALAERSLSRRHIIIEAGLAPQAVSWLAAHGWAVTSWATRYREANGQFSGFWGGDCERWRRGERWADHAWSVAEACLRDLSTCEQRFAAAPLGEGPPLYVIIKAWEANPHLEAINALLLRYFPGQQWLDITEDMSEAPLLAANLRQSTPLFSAGQKVYIYNTRSGSNGDQAMVVARYRRKRRWICGYCAVDHLDHFRPQISHNPHVIEALLRSPPGRRYVAAGLFRLFLPFPAEPERP